MNRRVNFVEGTITSLNKNNPFQFALRHTMEIYKSDAVYTFIPKNACSTLRYSVAKSNGYISSEKDIHWIHANNQTFSLNLKSLAQAKYTFAILRCPFSRLISVFLDKFVGQTPDAFQFYIKMGRKSNPLEMTFAKFVEALEKPGMLKSNIHWRPQSDFLIYEEYDDYFAMENFGTLSNTLKEKINFEVCDARKLTNHGMDGLTVEDKETSNVDLAIIDIINMKNEGKIIAPKSLYNNEIYAKVNKLFRADVKLYVDKFGASNLMKI